MPPEVLATYVITARVTWKLMGEKGLTMDEAINELTKSGHQDAIWFSRPVLCEMLKPQLEKRALAQHLTSIVVDKVQVTKKRLI